MYSVKDLDIDVRKTQCHPSLTIQELFIDVHQKLLLDQETRLRKKALRRRPFPKTGPAQAQESKHAVSVLRMMHMLRDGSTAGEVYTEFRNQSDSLQGFLRQTFISELQKPGGGVLTMDFCTMGMFILGLSASFSNETRSMAYSGKILFWSHLLVNRFLIF